MGLRVTVIHRKNVRRHQIPIPGFAADNEEIYIAISPFRYVLQQCVPACYSQGAWRWGADCVTIAAPPTFNLLTAEQETRSCSPGSEAFYCVEAYRTSADTRVGMLVQLLRAYQEVSIVHPHRKRHRAAYTSRHCHPVKHADCPNITEYFFPVFGTCKLRTAANCWNPLTKLETVVPGVMHELRCDSEQGAVNLLWMTPLPEPYRVRGAPHAYTEQPTASVRQQLAYAL